MADYEEYREWNTFWSWLFILSLPIGLLSWAMIIMFTVRDVPREWDFGNVEFTPGASVYSTWDPEEDPARMRELWLEKRGLYDTAKAGKLPDDQMIYPLPEGIPMEELQKPDNENK